MANFIIVFTANGVFTPPANTTSVNYLIVAGGGGGAAAGGGAGGVLAGTCDVTPLTDYPVVVGAGGAGAGWGGASSNGQNSAFNELTAIGGGGCPHIGAGYSGGSGGGGNGGDSPNQYVGGIGTAGQGYAGGAGYGNGIHSGGGGGGASAVGADGTVSSGGSGGAGVESSLSGAAVTYAAGGDGWSSAQGTHTGASAQANTGDGGEGGYSASGGDGGSGVVILSYAVINYAEFEITGGTEALGSISMPRAVMLDLLANIDVSGDIAFVKRKIMELKGVTEASGLITTGITTSDYRHLQSDQQAVAAFIHTKLPNRLVRTEV